MYTPGASSSAAPSAKSTSKWTPEQQQVVDATSAYRALVAKYRRGSTKLDRAALRRVATEARAVQAEKDIVGGLAFGFILVGDDALRRFAP